MTAPGALALAALALLAGACRFDPHDAPDDGQRPIDAPDDASVDAPPDGPRTDWWAPAWTKRRPITIHGEQLMGSLDSFPVLVRLPATIGKADGSDLRFVTQDHMDVHPHALDALDVGGTTFLWLRLPTLSNAAATTLWLYYGNEDAENAASGAAVFADQFVSVHHLGDELTDATGHGHTAEALPGSVPAAVTANIGRARDFDGNNDYLTLLGEPDYDFTQTFSVSAWIRRDTLNRGFQAIVTKGDTSWRLHRDDQSSFLGFAHNANGQNQNDCVGAISINNNDWHHVAIVLANNTKRLYVDGALDKMSMNTPTPVALNDLAVSFGYNANPQSGTGNRNWDGQLDEIRISANDRSAAWMHAEHHTVTAGSFVVIGEEEPYAP